jgi:hypothetical protein
MASNCRRVSSPLAYLYVYSECGCMCMYVWVMYSSFHYPFPIYHTEGPAAFHFHACYTGLQLCYWTVHLTLNAMNFNSLLAMEVIGCSRGRFPSCNGNHRVSYRHFGSCHVRGWHLLQTPCLVTWQLLMSPADPLPQAMAGADVSCRPYSSCCNSHHCLLQIPCLMPWQLLVSPVDAFPSCCNAHQCLLQSPCLMPWQLLASPAAPLAHSMTVMAYPADPLPHAMAGADVSCRPYSSCYNRHQCLLQNPYLTTWQSPRSTTYCLSMS